MRDAFSTEMQFRRITLTVLTRGSPPVQLVKTLAEDVTVWAAHNGLVSILR